jgi:hypothetical protein
LHRTFSLEYSHHTVHDLRNEAMWLCKAESSSSGRSGVLSEKAEGQCWTGRFPCIAGLQSVTRRGPRGTEGKIGEVLGNFRQLGQVDSGGCVRESGATDMGGVAWRARDRENESRQTHQFSGHSLISFDSRVQSGACFCKVYIITHIVGFSIIQRLDIQYTYTKYKR